MLTQARLKELLEYRDGKFYWKVFRAGNANVGDEAGCASFHKNKNIYRWMINIGGIKYLRSRLVFLYFNEYFPSSVDHINRQTLDDRIENLRAATPSQQQMNHGIQSNNTSGHKGVYYRKDRATYQAYININNKRIYLGCYKTKAEAVKVRTNKAKELFGEFFNIG